MEILREKNKGLELRLADLMRHGHDNDRTQQRMHAWQLRLLAEPDSHALPYAVQDGLQQVFDVPAVAVKLWSVAEQYAHMEVVQGASDDLRLFAEGLRAPYCGANAGFEAASLLELDEVASLAMVACARPCEPRARCRVPPSVCSCWARPTRAGSTRAWARLT